MDNVAVQIELPGAGLDVLPGVKWGLVEAFPTPAYWAYQVLARRIMGTRIKYRLGNSLCEEVGACLLGGHGIPAAVGLAAFASLRAKGAFSGPAHSEDVLFAWLSTPLQMAGGKQVRYRFAQQKARYLAAALARLSYDSPPLENGRVLRDWLLDFPGIGPKTASWIARNWLDADDVAILDIHILRAGRLAGFFPPSLTVEKHYSELEEWFLRFSKAIGVRPSELDAVIWYEMVGSRAAVESLLQSLAPDLGDDSSAHA
jgi:N-glycosylase/DNA lyase